jgi:transposase
MKDRIMEKIATVGLDLAKSVFQLHGVDDQGRIMLRRSQVLDFFRKLPRCLVGMEACGSAHYWAREIAALGHDVKMIPPIYVKAYVKRSKTDAADAEAICEAVTRPTMRFVPIKTSTQQAAGMILKTRDLLVRQRSQTANAFRSHMSELGIVSAAGMASIGKLSQIIRNPESDDIPDMARRALQEMVEQIVGLTERIERLDREILATVKGDEVARRLTTIPGVGPLIAATVRAVVQDAGSFPTGRLNRVDASGAFQRRERTDRRNFEARQPSTPDATHYWGHFHRQASKTRCEATAVARRADTTQAIQGCRRGARQQNRPNDLGASREGWILSQTLSPRDRLNTQRGFRQQGLLE